VIRVGLPEALSTARGTLRGMDVTGGPRADRERYVAQALDDLVAAVGPLVEEAT